MSSLALAIIVIGAPLLVLNLLLTLGVVARLRQIQERLDNQTLDPTLVPKGTQIGGFEAKTVDGNDLTDRTVVELGQVLVGFFSPGCGTCVGVREQLARNPPALPVIAVIDGDPSMPRAKEYGRSFEQFARVTFGDPESAISKAFQTTSYPTLVRLRGGVVVASANTLAGVMG